MADVVTDTLFDVWIDVTADIGAELLTVLNENILADAITTLWPVITAVFEGCEPFCRTTSSCCCVHALQAQIPSYHVWPSFWLPTAPQSLNHEPPRPQQLVLPDFSKVPHLRHSDPLVVVVTVGVHV